MHSDLIAGETRGTRISIDDEGLLESAISYVLCNTGSPPKIGDRFLAGLAGDDGLVVAGSLV